MEIDGARNNGAMEVDGSLSSLWAISLCTDSIWCVGQMQALKGKVVGLGRTLKYQQQVCPSLCNCKVFLLRQKANGQTEIC